ncbi:Katanin p80 WD40 repeat-containing subunit B1-like [Vitis vinifera]|uniref:Katanin p80 WD40 repeat-containing subunit B1-like n=1 Tax=Vitis vinifera TaxID=29760 RepID=A0A438EU07_VITVI|nr:Katanin p80 WD40 repeat-containing subunit B1-like [Vitis vinifera]
MQLGWITLESNHESGSLIGGSLSLVGLQRIFSLLGSADRTVKFWDLETFELIGSAGPETAGVRCMTFNPDGKTLLCGLHESLKVFSWEPIRCHDAVDVGWSRLSDLNIHEGKLLGCSYNQSCVGVWVVDLSRIEPYAVGNVTRLNGHSESKSSSSGNLSVLTENTTKASLGSFSLSFRFWTLFLSWLYILAEATGSVPGTPQRVNLNTGPKTTLASSTTAPKRISAKAHSTANVSAFNKSDVIPVIVPRTNVRLDQAAESRKEVGVSGRTIPFSLQSRTSDFRKSPNRRDELERPTVSVPSENAGSKATDLSTVADRNIFPAVKCSTPGISAAERNVKDDRCIGSGRQEMNSTMEPLLTTTTKIVCLTS